MNKTTNTSGIIAAAANKKQQPDNLQKPLTPTQKLNKFLNNADIQNQLQQTLKDNAGAFAASLINLFQSDTGLQACDPKDVLAEALKAAALQLPIEKSLGFAYVVPYNNKPQFQIGYKGLIQLCLRSGVYKHINSGAVYDGENVEVDRLSGTIKISGAPISDKVIGYFAYVKTLNGFEHGLYWTRKQVEDHKKDFSKTDKVWGKHFDEMAAKTVLKNLLNKYAPISVVSGVMSEPYTEDLPEPVSKEIETMADEVTEPVADNAESAPPPAENSPAPDDYPFAE